LDKVAYILFFLSLWGFSCNFLDKENGEGTLARVYDNYLYNEDIQDLNSNLIGEKDSATIVNNFINNWVQQELLLEKAELNLSEDQKDFQKLLENYRRSLIIYAFQKEWIRQKLDTNVLKEEISAYYESNQANFELKENIIKMRFAKVAKNAPKLSQLEKMIQGKDNKSKDAFREYCIQYALDYNDNDSIWIPFDKIKMKLPLNIESEEVFLRKNKFIVRADSANYFLLFIDDYKIKNAISPLSFESEKIRNIIVNQRKLTLISKMKADLYEKAVDKGNVEIYTP